MVMQGKTQDCSYADSCSDISCGERNPNTVSAAKTCTLKLFTNTNCLQKHKPFTNTHCAKPREILYEVKFLMITRLLVVSSPESYIIDDAAMNFDDPKEIIV